MDPSNSLTADGVALHLIGIYLEEIESLYPALNEAQLLPLLTPLLDVLY